MSDASQLSRAASTSRATFIFSCVFAIAVYAAYSNSLRNPFVLDDFGSIKNNPTIRSLWPLTAVFTPPNANETVASRPLLNFSFALNWAVGGDEVAGYHLTNIAIHILAGLTLFGIVRRTLLLPSMRRRFGDDAFWFAAIVALIWSLHPIQTESVTYTVQRAESLMGLFYLLTLYCFVRGVRSGSPRMWFVASVIACGLGMATKEVIASAPLIVLLYDRAFVSRTFRRALMWRWPLYAALACTWLPLVYLILRSGSHGGTTGTSTGITPFQYAQTQLVAISRYLRLSIWPHPLVWDYGPPVVPRLGEALLRAIPVVGLACAAVLALWRAPKLGFLGAWFFAILAPSSSFLPIGTQAIVEHRMYLSLAAVVTAIVLVAWSIERRADSETLSTIMLVAVVMILTVLGGLTYLRNRDYRSALELWRTSIRVQPDVSRAQTAVGILLCQTEQARESLPYFERALKLNPANSSAYNSRGIAYQALGRDDRAVTDFSEALRLRAYDGGLYQNRAVSYYRLGKYAEANADVKRASELGTTPDPKLVLLLRQADPNTQHP